MVESLTECYNEFVGGLNYTNAVLVFDEDTEQFSWDSDLLEEFLTNSQYIVMSCGDFDEMFGQGLGVFDAGWISDCILGGRNMGSVNN